MSSRLVIGHQPWQSNLNEEGAVMLIYSMNVSVDGFIADREGGFGWTAPSEELFRFHLDRVRELGGYLLDLVDELRMFRIPVVVGGGTPFLPPVTEAIALELVETWTVGAGVIYERYGRARDELD